MLHKTVANANLRKGHNMLRLSLQESHTVTRKVTGNFEGDFEVTIRQPTAAERMEARGLAITERIGELQKFRASLIVGWNGMTDADGKEIPFNPRTQELVLRIQPVQDAINSTVRAYLEESSAILTEDDKKKSESQPVNTGVEQPAATP